MLKALQVNHDIYHKIKDDICLMLKNRGVATVKAINATRQQQPGCQHNNTLITNLLEFFGRKNG